MTPVVFDLDGTLVHSAPDIHAAVNRMLDGIGQAPLTLATVGSFVGRGVPSLVDRVIEHLDLDPGRHDDMVAAMLEHYNRAPADLTRPYPGVPEMLETLAARGHPLAVCTNKPEAPARRVLSLLGLGTHIAAVVGGDSLSRRKPDPAPLRHTFALLGHETGLFVGDSEVDAECAQRAGVPFLLFSGGYRKGPVTDLPHHAVFDHFGDLAGLVAPASV
ncbi:phosphoglycolate phosphatase [Cribrihabitans marinus]|uniref:Phosphoglycolate phosphatase n=1 Tax=Cribrihabitans marinus TaxID=1227549 RepID=A0A1H6RLA8_9RHOB|nr:phosphoglycolate phosphatase [Cribrihabitans marinus]GGH20769.1 phosphoglycolate phosphatase [Cribrihabitans marinus]SEI52590.1 phosphoglycolate phosphatase [Cribrihabitans marinus]